VSTKKGTLAARERLHDGKELTVTGKLGDLGLIQTDTTTVQAKLISFHECGLVAPFGAGVGRRALRRNEQRVRRAVRKRKYWGA
jgi:hypothetical protein